MATECIHKEVRIITLSRKEVVDMIVFLVADLAGRHYLAMHLAR